MPMKAAELESARGGGVVNWLRAQPRGWLAVAAVQAAVMGWKYWLEDPYVNPRFGWLFWLLIGDVACLITLAITSRRAIPLMLLVTAGTLAAAYPSFREIRRISEDKSVGTYQIRAALAVFFTEFPERMFVSYDEIVGPTCWIKGAIGIKNEDYTAMFPVRRDWDLLSVIMDDGRKVILVDTAYLAVSVLPSGKVMGRPEDVAHYLAWLASQAGRNGVVVSRGLNADMELAMPKTEGRFETTWHNGVREGPFHAYYENGALWAEATYVDGWPVGRHVVYDRTGKVIYETTFPPHPAPLPR